jgi:hypothetical protein
VGVRRRRAHLVRFGSLVAGWLSSRSYPPRGMRCCGSGPHRVRLRCGDQHVVHTQFLEPDKKPWYHQGDYFPKRNYAARPSQVRISDLTLPQVPDHDLASVLIRGKGNKARRCPLWAQTVRELAALVQGRDPSEHVFS